MKDSCWVGRKGGRRRVRKWSRDRKKGPGRKFEINKPIALETVRGIDNNYGGSVTGIWGDVGTQWNNTRIEVQSPGIATDRATKTLRKL